MDSYGMIILWYVAKQVISILDRSRHKRKTPREEEKEHTTSGPQERWSAMPQKKYVERGSVVFSC